MKDKMKVTFDLESNPEFRFQAIYEGLIMIKEKESTNVDSGKFSLVGAEAYCMLQDLKISHPRQFADAESNYLSISNLRSDS